MMSECRKHKPVVGSIEEDVGVIVVVADENVAIAVIVNGVGCVVGDVCISTTQHNTGIFGKPKFAYTNCV